MDICRRLRSCVLECDALDGVLTCTSCCTPDSDGRCDSVRNLLHNPPRLDRDPPPPHDHRRRRRRAGPVRNLDDSGEHDFVGNFENFEEQLVGNSVDFEGEDLTPGYLGSQKY